MSSHKHFGFSLMVMLCAWWAFVSLGDEAQHEEGSLIQQELRQKQTKIDELRRQLVQGVRSIRDQPGDYRDSLFRFHEQMAPIHRAILEEGKAIDEIYRSLDLPTKDSEADAALTLEEQELDDLRRSITTGVSAARDLASTDPDRMRTLLQQFLKENEEGISRLHESRRKNTPTIVHSLPDQIRLQTEGDSTLSEEDRTELEEAILFLQEVELIRRNAKDENELRSLLFKFSERNRFPVRVRYKEDP